jgi:hypothetical protein
MTDVSEAGASEDNGSSAAPDNAVAAPDADTSVADADTSQMTDEKS